MRPNFFRFLARGSAGFLRAGLVAAAVVAAAPVPAEAAVPGTAVVEGILTSSAGGAAADGNYKITFSLFKDETGGNPLWSEIDVVVSVKGGVFSYALGSKTALSQQLLTDVGGKAWLALKIDSDPELPRKPLASVVYALRAGSAEALECSGCVKAAHLDSGVLGPYAKTADLAKVAVSGDFADLKGGPDLSAYAKVAGLAKVATSGAFADLTGGPDLSAYAKLAALADVAKSGNYADLKGLPVLAKIATTGEFADLKTPPVLAKLGASCGSGLVVKGLKADGTYECVPAMDPSAFPPDAIDEISNGLLINQFQDTTAGTPDVVIKDGFLFGVADNLTFPDIGIAQKLNVSVHLQNSDIAFVTVTVFDPAGVEHVLYDKGAKGTELKTSFPNPTKQVTKDLTTWVGKNPKGVWTLKVVDSGAPTGGATDGKIVKWSVDIQTLSSKKVGTTGDLVLGGGLQLKVADAHPTTCDASKFGYMYANKKDNAIFVCNGTGFFPLLLSVPPGNKENPAANCQQIIVANPSAKSGSQWLDPDGQNGPVVPYEGYCDMSHAKGGWTLVFNLDTNDGSLREYGDGFWTNPTSLVGSAASPLTSDFKSLTHGQVPATEILIVAHQEGVDWGGKPTYARYKLASGHANKTMQQLMALGANTQISAGGADELAGAIAKNAYTRNAGDIFIDHGLPIQVNSTASGGTAAKNTARFGADFSPLCGHVNCNGHNVLGGYGGYHIVPSQSNYPLTYEAMPSFGYHPGPMGFGDNFVNNNGCGNSVWSNQCGPENAKLQVDFAIYVR